MFEHRLLDFRAYSLELTMGMNRLWCLSHALRIFADQLLRYTPFPEAGSGWRMGRGVQLMVWQKGSKV